MPLLAIALSSFLLSKPRVPARENRITFYLALKQVGDGISSLRVPSKSEVKALLGPPDDVWTSADNPGAVPEGQEVWCYGSDGHLSLPSLGTIWFSKDKATWVRTDLYHPPPPMAVMSDAEMERHLRAIYRGPCIGGCQDWSNDPLRIIRAANDLRPLGREKALAVMCEFSRLSPDSTWLFWLARVLFKPGSSNGFFQVPMIGAIDPRAPKDLSKWPTYPLLISDDVPLNTFRGVLLRGSPEPFIEYVKRASDNWVLTSKKLRPPDDPFPSYLTAIRSPQWPFPHVDPNHTRFAVPYLEDEGYLLRDVLSLVRTAYGAKEFAGGREPYINGLDYDRYHKEFLALGCRWDDQRQMYVRRDGSFDPDLGRDLPGN